jgi:hypothetical protein
MRRFLPLILLVSLLVFLQGRAPSFAQEAAQQKSAAPSWQTMSERAWKTDLGGEKPEVLILKMSNEEFEKFHASKKAAMDYIDDHHFLKKKLIKVVFCDIVPHKDGEEWYVIVPHTTHSTAVVVAWQIPD